MNYILKLINYIVVKNDTLVKQTKDNFHMSRNSFLVWYSTYTGLYTDIVVNLYKG